MLIFHSLKAPGSTPGSAFSRLQQLLLKQLNEAAIVLRHLGNRFRKEIYF